MNKAVIADIGGTNARFAIVDAEGRIAKETLTESSGFFIDPVKVVRDYLRNVDEHDIKVGILAIAGPVFDGRIENKDMNFSCSIKELGLSLAMDSFDIINDFAAQALSVPYLTDNDCVRISNRGEKRINSPMAVIGPGTGLGAGILVPLSDGTYQAIATEGGHVNAPFPFDNYTRTIIENVYEIIKSRGKNYISAEDLISGRGLPNIYAAVKKIRNEKCGSIPSNPDITRLMVAGDAAAVETFKAFFNLLGAVAGNYAISCGAVGGVYLAGGMLLVPDIYKAFLKSGFRTEFENKGAASIFAADIPTFLITHKNPAFLGLSALAKKQLKRK